MEKITPKKIDEAKKAIEKVKENSKCKIVSYYQDFIIEAKDEEDLRIKRKSIYKGQTSGFKSVKEILSE